MAADLGRLVATLEARAERFDLTLQRATQRLDKVASQTEQANQRIARSTFSLDGIAQRAAKGFAYLGTAFAGAATAVGYFAARQVAALDKLGDLAQQTGLSATELRKLQVGLELSGGTADQAGEGLLTFSRNLGQVEAGTGRLTGLLKKLDPAFLGTLRSAGSTQEALRLIADRIAVARTEQEKLAIATAAFGPAGRQFVLLLGDGARGVDALSERLESLGIGNLDELAAAAQRFDDSMKLLKATVTTQFTAGLFGVGEGLQSISDALDDNTVRDIGETAKGIGELVGWLSKLELQEISAWTQFFLSLKSGEGFGTALDKLNEGLAPLEALQKQFEETQRAIDETKKKLRSLGDEVGAQAPSVALPPALPLTIQRREAIERERARLLEEQARLERLKNEIQVRQPFTGPPRQTIPNGPDLSGIETPGAKGIDKEVEAARRKVEQERERILQGQDQFIEQMRQSSLGALTEAQKLSLNLAETLGKIGKAAQAGTISTTEAIEFQTAAIDEAVAAIEAAERRADSIREKAQSGVELDLKRARISVDEGSLFGASEALKRDLERAEAIVAKSKLDENVREAYSGGDPAKLEAALAENQRILEEKLADINSSWDETIGSVVELGQESMADFFRGIAEGSDASFEDMARSFALRLLEMEATALGTDLIGALTGNGDGPTSITGQILGKVIGGEEGDGEAKRAEEAGASISSQLLESLESGAGRLVEAGAGAGKAIAGAGSAILNAGLEAAAAIVQALAAQGAAAIGFLGLAEGGGVTQRGVVRLERIPALAKGGYVASSTALSERIPALAEGGGITALVGEAGTERLLTLSTVREIALRAGSPEKAAAYAKQVGMRLDHPEIRNLVPGDIVIPDRKLTAFFSDVMPQHRLAEGGSVMPLQRTIEALGDVSGSSEVNVTIVNESGTALGVKRREVKRAGRRTDILMVVGDAGATDVRSGGPMSREMQRTFGVRPEPRAT